MQNQGHYNDEIEIDLLDLLKTIMKQWKVILISMVLCGVIGGGYAILRNSAQKTSEVTAEDIQKAVEKLSDEDAAEVRNAYRQFTSYTKYKDSLQMYSNTFFISSDSSGFMRKITKYNVTSTATGVSGILADFSLTPEIYEEIKGMLTNGENENIINVYRYVTINYDSGNTIAISNYGNEEVRPIQSVLTVSVVGNSEEQCTQITSLVEQSLEEQMDTVHKIDPSATMTYLGYNYNYDMKDWLTNEQNSSASLLEQANKMLTDVNNTIKAFSSDQTAYYKLLEQRDTVEIYKPVSIVKYGLIGVLLGLVIVFGYYSLIYVLDGTVKTGDELKWIINGKTPHSIGNPENSSNIDKLMRTNDTPIELIAENQTITFSKLKKKNLYVIAEDKCYRSNEFNEAMFKLKKSIIGDVQVGNPLMSAEELSKLSNADAAIIVVRLKATKMKDVQMMNQYCQNYGVPVNDIIVLSE